MATKKKATKKTPAPEPEGRIIEHDAPEAQPAGTDLAPAPVYSGPIAPPIQLPPVSSFKVQRELIEVQSRITLAAANLVPRDVATIKKTIVKECELLKIADQAFYEYKRGDTTISGPTIRLLEVVAQHWPHTDTSIRRLGVQIEETLDGWCELDMMKQFIPRRRMVEYVEACAWDVRTGRLVKREIGVPLERLKWATVGKKRVPTIQRLDDPRDQRELVDSFAMRLLRQCIATIVPRELVEAAEEACTRTLDKWAVSATRITNMVTAYKALGVPREHLEQKMGCALNVEDLGRVGFARLRQLYGAVKDNEVTIEATFPYEPVELMIADKRTDKVEDKPKTTKKKAATAKPKRVTLGALAGEDEPPPHGEQSGSLQLDHPEPPEPKKKKTTKKRVKATELEDDWKPPE